MADETKPAARRSRTAPKDAKGKAAGKAPAKKAAAKQAPAKKPAANKTPAKKPAAKPAASKTAAAKTAAPKKAPSTNGAANHPGDADFRFYTGDAPSHEDLGLSTDDLTAMYRNMLLQRRFEERAAQMYGRQKIAGFLHLYIGQEAVSAGTIWALRHEDPIVTAYRDHGLGLARGMTANECMAELFGKIDGSSRGKGGSMHFFSKEHHFYGGHGIVGGQIPLAVGLGFAEKYRKTGGCAIGFFGDGALNQGAFHEAMNLASLYDVPCLLACENNAYSMGTALHRSTAETALYKQAYGYGMTGAVVDGMDVFHVYHAIKELGDQARNDFRPSFIEVQTYRYRGHSMSDPQKYRTKEELEAKKNEDPIVRLKAYMLEHGLAKEDFFESTDDEVKAEVAASVEFAENSPYPPIETMYEDVYVQEDYPFIV